MSSPDIPPPFTDSTARQRPTPTDRQAAIGRYWRRVLLLTGVLLVIWILAGPVLSILLAEPLNSVSLGGIPLGFWFAQQGSILIFLGLILIYALLMNRLDRQYRREIRPTHGGFEEREGEVRP